jgi:DNA-binding PadR family transcriptional regulator
MDRTTEEDSVDVLGGFEHRVLLVLVRLGGRAYSVPVVQELERVGGRTVAPAAVYVTLRRLEKRGMLTSEMVPAEDGEAGRPRRFFAVEEAASEALRAARADLENLWAGVEALGL